MDNGPGFSSRKLDVWAKSLSSKGVMFLGLGLKCLQHFMRHGAEQGGAGNDILYQSLTQNFNSERKAPTRSISRAQQKLLGQLSGRVFEDRNDNGHWDEGEPGIPGIALNLKGNVKSQADANGQFSFSAIALGDYRVRLITNTLPIALTTLTPTEVPLEVGAGQKLTLDFPVMKTGNIQGVVFRDDNRNGQRDANEAPISEAIVHIQDSDIIACTDEQGRFTLSGLPPRHWKISVDTQTRGDDLAATNSAPIEVAVPSNGEVQGIRLGLAPVQKAVVNTFQEGV